MTFSIAKTAAASLFAGAMLAAGSASAQQPLDVFVRPVTTIVQAPFTIVGGVVGGVGNAVGGVFGRPGAEPTGVYNPGPARRAAVSTTADGLAVVPAGVLRETGPQYVNPANADYQRPIVLRRGSTVPGYVNTAPARNISVAGLAPNAGYDFFVSPQSRIVFVNPTTRQVERIVR